MRKAIGVGLDTAFLLVLITNLSDHPASYWTALLFFAAGFRVATAAVGLLIRRKARELDQEQIDAVLAEFGHVRKHADIPVRAIRIHRPGDSASARWN
jgi:hypothetical protein